MNRADIYDVTQNVCGYTYFIGSYDKT